MEFEFNYNALNQPMAEFSMGHEAFGHWFTEELGKNKSKIDSLLQIVEQLENHESFEHELIGIDLKLSLNRTDVEVTGLHEYEEDDIPEETDYSEDHTHAMCGLLDFKQALQSWWAFVGQ